MRGAGYGWRALGLIGLLVGMILWQPVGVRAATDTVTTCNETTLRSVINSAAAGDTVNFGCTGTITLTAAGGGAITLSKNLTIDGTGHTVTISGGNAVGVFSVSSGVHFTVANLTIANGNALGGGGGIFNNGGTVTVSNSTISGNSAPIGGGIYNSSGTVTVTNSTLSGNTATSTNGLGGGGIINYGTLTVSNSTLSGNSASSDGGGIHNQGTLTLTNSTLSANSASNNGGGIANFNNGTLSVTNSTFSGNSASNAGGGIFITVNQATTLSITNSTIRGNSATYGGGIFSQGGTVTVSNSTLSGNTATSTNGLGGGGIINYGTLTVSNSTLSGNSASSDGGGIHNQGTLTLTSSTLSANSASNSGGGIASLNSRMGITNSTISGNSAGVSGGGCICSGTITASTFSGNSASEGGGIESNGTLSVTNSTLSGNSAGPGGGGGLAGFGTGQLANTIVANSPSGGNCAGNAAVSDLGGNVDDGTTCRFGAGSHSSTNPMLGPLANNGGPTQTIALLLGSPAIDFTTCRQTTDQRGYPRPDTGEATCDSGAYETQATDTVTTCNETTLRSVISSAAAGDTVKFGCSGTITLTAGGGGAITLSKILTIDGTGQAVTISGGGSVQVFVVNSGVTVTLNDLTIANGSSPGDGGGILNSGTLTVTNSTLSGNSATTSGGGILNNAMLIVTNSTFSGNSATTGFGGGGIDNFGGTLTVTNSTFSGNTAPGQTGFGGGINNGDGTVTVSNSTFSGNSAGSGTSTQGGGGGIYNNSRGGTLTVTNSTFSGNTATGVFVWGGGIDNAEGTVTVSNSSFSGNTASGQDGFGGGILNWGTLTLTNSSLSGNSATYGGGVENCSCVILATVTLTNSTLSGNSASSGGGINNVSGNAALLANTIVANSSAGGNCVGSVTDQGGNVDDGTTCGFGPGSLSNTNPQLGPLANNGGPTQTIALLPGSVAIDFAVAHCPSTDQRGSPRPDNGEAKCDSGAFEFQDSAFASSTSLSSSANPSVVGQAVTFTATVHATGGIPTGTVTFLDGGTLLGTGALNASGVATFTATSLNVGKHSITATYAGIGSYLASTSMPLLLSVVQARSVVVLTSSLNPATFGQMVTFTARVAITAGNASGTVTFRDGTTVLQTVPVVNGLASYSTSSLSRGIHPIYAVYTGPATVTPSTALLFETIR